MAKFNLRVFKRGKPIYWILGGIFIFVVFYLLFNKGGGSSGNSGGVQVVQSGPSEAMQVAAMQMSGQLQMAQLQAGIEAARVQGEKETASLGAQVALAQIQSAADTAALAFDRELEMAHLSAQTSLHINEQNLAYSTESARIAAETNVALKGMDVALLQSQMETQYAMFSKSTDAQLQMYEIQSHNLIAQNILGQIQNLKKKDRDNVLKLVGPQLLGQNPDPLTIARNA